MIQMYFSLSRVQIVQIVGSRQKASMKDGPRKFYEKFKDKIN